MSDEKASQAKPSSPLLDKADRFIRSAKILTKEGDFDSAASRLYYAMLFTAQALLESQGLIFTSHRATISAFGQRFAKTGLLDAGYHKGLLNAFSQRQLGDYSIDSGIREQDIEILQGEAVAFLREARVWLSRNAPNQ